MMYVVVYITMQQQQLTGFNGRRIAYYYFFLFLLSWLYLFDRVILEILEYAKSRIQELLMSQGG
jgi:hypothetical protein